MKLSKYRFASSCVWPITAFEDPHQVCDLNKGEDARARTA